MTAPRWEASAPSVGRLGVVLAPTERAALAAAADRWPFAPAPIAVRCLELLLPASDPTKSPEALAKRAATMARKAVERHHAEAEMTPGQRAYRQKARKATQAGRWRRYYLAKQGTPTVE
jgi:hypothetical protein